MSRSMPLSLLACFLLVGLPPAQASEPAPKPQAAAQAAVRAAAQAAPAAGPAGAAGPNKLALKSEEEMLHKLRERLASKLGAAKAVEPKGAGLVRVSARASLDDEAAHTAPGADSKAGHKAAAHATGAPAQRGATTRGRGAAPAEVAAAAAAHAPHWSYSGEAGPKAWGGLKPEFNLCANGKRQSPIDIRDGIAVDLEPIQFDYRASPFRVIDNGHTVQVNVEPGNAIVARGQRYELVQFHFHRPAEERINGRSFDMSLHLVHKDSDGRLAVVGLLMNKSEVQASGQPVMQPVVQTVWNNLPLEKNEEISTRAVLDLNHVLPPDRGYYTYMGSLTTPPCSEGVLWMVMRQPLAITPEQIEVFARLYPMNARPVQQAAGRMIKQSN